MHIFYFLETKETTNVFLEARFLFSERKEKPRITKKNILKQGETVRFYIKLQMSIFTGEISARAAQIFLSETKRYI